MRRKKEKRIIQKRVFVKKYCRFCVNKIDKIDYLDYQNFKKLVTEKGKILPSRFTGSCARHQRQIARAIKRARQVALMPYVAE